MNHRIFFDTNVLLDHLLDRAPYADDATELWSLAERREVVGLISAISFNFIYYIVRHEANERAARRAIKGLRDVFQTVEVDAQIINQAIDSGFSDFRGRDSGRLCRPRKCHASGYTRPGGFPAIGNSGNQP